MAEEKPPIVPMGSMRGTAGAFAILERLLDLREPGLETLEQDGFLVRHI